MSNPQSFCRASQVEMCGPHQEREVESLKGGVGGGRPRFVLREGDCDLSCCMEEEEENPVDVVLDYFYFVIHYIPVMFKYINHLLK